MGIETYCGITFAIGIVLGFGGGILFSTRKRDAKGRFVK